MTLDEAIKHAEEVVQEKRYEYQDCLEAHDREAAKDCFECGLQHCQLAEWLKELKAVKDIIAQHDEDIMPEDYWYIDKIRKVLREVKS